MAVTFLRRGSNGMDKRQEIHSRGVSNLANFKVITQRPKGLTFDLAGGSYELEMETLSTIGAEVVETSAEIGRAHV